MPTKFPNIAIVRIADDKRLDLYSSLNIFQIAECYQNMTGNFIVVKQVDR